MEQVADGMDPFGGQHVGNARSHAFDVLNRGRKFEHALMSKPALAMGKSFHDRMVAGASDRLRRPSQGLSMLWSGFSWETVGSTRVSKPLVLVNLVQALVAIIIGNLVYFALVPSLPPVARHRPLHPDLGMAVDFWFCLVVYGLIRTARKWR